jgi:long-subunit fatty acid transport protein
MPRSVRHGIGAALMASICATTAGAAGIERYVPSIRILFEPGRYLEFSLAYADPDLEGEGGALGPGVPITGSTGDIFDGFSNLGAAFKADLTERLSYALVADQPYGTSTAYPRSLYAGTVANIDTVALTGILAYDVTPAVKVYGGIRAQRMKADSAIPFLGGYDIKTDTDIGYGYMLGAAYQKPEIALRVALTYHSAIRHDFNTVEFGSIDSPLSVETPQSIALEFQSGVAANTLVFGSVRWVDWPQSVTDPVNYPLDVPMVEYEEAWTSYTLGLGRQFNDRLAGALQVSYEPATDTVLTTLGPVDGGVIATASLSYELDPFTISGGVSYGWLGEAENEAGTRFEDGRLTAIGLRLGYHF